MAFATPRTTSRLVALAVLSIAIGAALRFAWPADIEFKGDERYVFARTQLESAWWPALGMPSSVGVRNPAMSVWVFVLLARVFHVTTPTGLAMTVMGLNVAALALLFAFAMKFVEKADRERWLWALALVAVSPLAVLLERKIWAPSVFPAFAMVFWAGWWRRDRRAGAFVWGLVGALLGQIQMSGFFFAAGVVAWEVIAGWRARDAIAGSLRHDAVVGSLDGNAPFARSAQAGPSSRTGPRPQWDAWLIGSVVGFAPMVPWLGYFLHHPSSQSAWDWRELVTPRFWLYGLTDSLGLGLHYNLGATAFLDFESGPRVAGIPTYLVGLAHGVVALTSVGLVTLALVRGWRARRSWRSAIEAPIGTPRALGATFVAYGVLMSLSGLVIYRHYLLVTYPLEWVLLAGLGLAAGRYGPRVLALLWASELAITMALLLYLHAHGGAPGDFGVAYRLQPGSASDAAANSQVAPSR